MIISIASGKGGTGKTTVAVSLASVLPGSRYIDCDVEEPNGHILLKPQIITEEFAYKLLPEINSDLCGLCGKCVTVCEFNALANLKFEIALFEEMCHSCGACTYFCPSKAISEVTKIIGTVRTGKVSGNIEFADAILNIGEISAVPLIKKLKEMIRTDTVNIIDSPPGTSCSMMEAVGGSDYCILVTESTPFGMNDLKLAIDVLNSLQIPFGVVINKYDESYTQLDEYLVENSIEILMKIPFDKTIAEAYSKGIIPLSENNNLRNEFINLFERLKKIYSLKVTCGE